MRVLSGIQPSGGLHMGNYFAMMRRMIKYQETSELFAFIVNLHALTTLLDGKELRANTLRAVADFLSLGLDPEKCTFWIQSDVPEVLELTWYLSNLTPVGLLERCHSYKDKVAHGATPNHGLLSYPVLMAADILLYQADRVPVGKDQKQHLEMSRDIAIRFNNAYGDTFTVPEPDIDQDVATVPGTDGQKMSKSYGNTIEIFTPEKELRKRIMGIVTDSTPLEAPKDPEKCIVFQLYKLVAEPARAQEMAQKYRAGGYGYGDAKKDLFAAVSDYFRSYREERERLLANTDHLIAVLKVGADKARAEASKTLDLVREKVGTNYHQ